MSTAVAQWPGRVGRLQIGEVQLDLRYRCVSHPEGRVELPQRMFDLLLLFAAEPGVLHSRPELFRRVWSGVVVEDGNLSQSVWRLRKALGPARRHWIRTVAKAGYVFEPPHPVVPVAVEEVLEQMAAAGAIADAGTDPGAGTGSAPAVSTALPVGAPLWLGRVGRGSGRSPLPALSGGTLAAVIAVMMVVALAVTAFGSRSGAPAAAAMDARPAGPAPLPQVMLIAVDDIGGPVAGGGDGTDPDTGASDAVTSLLLGWLRWQLAMTPQLQLVEPGLPEGFDAGPQATVVLLASRYWTAGVEDAGDRGPGAWPDDQGTSAATGQLRIRAWLRTPHGSHQVRSQGPADDVAGLIGQVADGVMAHLLPAPTALPARSGSGTALAIESQADVRMYRELLQASQARQWPAVIRIGTGLVAQAPGFGLAHWHLAQAHGQLHQYRAAHEHLQVAQALLAPTGVAAELFRAHGLAWSGQHERAADSYRHLAVRYPRQVGFALDQAEALQAAGRAQAAVDVLAGLDLSRQPAALQVRQQLLRADIALAMADADGARTAALRAGQLAAAAGWPPEAGLARRLYGQAGTPALAAAAPDTAAGPSPAIDAGPWLPLQLVAETAHAVTGCAAPGPL